MEIEFSHNKIKFEKKLNSLDKFTLEFITILDKLDIKYVLVSGYVAILFGRDRSSEDIDIIIEKIDFSKFNNLWDKLNESFECLNTLDMKDAYEDYMLTGHSIRFSKKNRFLPNMEVKFPKVELESLALEERKETILNEHKIYISPLELQISFKLFLGSEKDIEDARHLYRLFKDKLDLELLKEFNRNLKIEERFNKYLE